MTDENSLLGLYAETNYYQDKNNNVDDYFSMGIHLFCRAKIEKGYLMRLSTPCISSYLRY